METMSLEDLMGELEMAKHNYEAAQKVAVECKDHLDSVKQVMIDKLAELGLKSAKSDKMALSIVQKPLYRIVDPTSLSTWIENEPTLDSRVYFRLDPYAVTQLAREAQKQQGRLIPGVEQATTEYLSIRETK